MCHHRPPLPDGPGRAARHPVHDPPASERCPAPTRRVAPSPTPLFALPAAPLRPSHACANPLARPRSPLPYPLLFASSLLTPLHRPAATPFCSPLAGHARMPAGRDVPYPQGAQPPTCLPTQRPTALFYSPGAGGERAHPPPPGAPCVLPPPLYHPPSFSEKHQTMPLCLFHSCTCTPVPALYPTLSMHTPQHCSAPAHCQRFRARVTDRGRAPGEAALWVRPQLGRHPDSMAGCVLCWAGHTPVSILLRQTQYYRERHLTSLPDGWLHRDGTRCTAVT